MKKSLAILLIVCFIILPFCVVPRASASTPLTVMGQVIDRHSTPVAGAIVQLINDEIYGVNWNILDTKTTDANGNFRFLNVLSSSPRIKVLVTYTENGKTYNIREPDSQWTDASQGLVTIDKRWTTLLNYPPPEYGHLWGVMLAEGGNARALGNGVVYVIYPSSEQMYYSFTYGNGAYDMRLPVGHYRVYGQFSENGILYESKKYEVDVIGAATKEGSNPLQITVPLSVPAGNPQPPEIPGTYANTVNGTVMYQDSTGVPDATVSLWQSSDDGAGNFFKKADTKTDSNGYYQFSNIRVTTDSPESADIYGRKTFRLSAMFTDPQGNAHVKNQSFSLYNPNVILGIGQSEQSARNMTTDLQFDYTKLGWIKIQCDPNGAKVFVDNQVWKGTDGKQLTTPCTAYIPAGLHTVRLSASGYVDNEYSVQMVENLETQTLIAHLDKPMVPSWVTLAVVVLILLIVAGLILALLASKRHMFMGPLAGVLAPLSRTMANHRSSGVAKKAQREAFKAHVAEIKKAEKARQAQVGNASPAGQPKLDGRKRDQTPSFGASEQRGLPEHAGDDLSMVSAREVYRKAENPEIERIPHAQATGSTGKNTAQARRDTLHRGAAPITAEPDGRIRVPRATPAVRDQPASTIKDKERVIRYIREHQDGVSFIQMSNELEVPPNTLTIITKELVINDDIEKVKGLYYYKTHDTSVDESKSSVVVWRLDGED